MNHIVNNITRKLITGHKGWLKVLFLAFGLLMVYFFISNSELDKIAKQIRRINWRFVFIIAITGFSYFLASKAWKICFSNTSGNIGIFRLFVIRLAGESFAQVNPANVIAGETLKMYHLSKHGISIPDSLSSIALSRFMVIISGLHLTMLFFVIFFDNFNFFPKYITISLISGITVFLIILSLYFIKNKRGILYPLCKAVSWIKWNWMIKIHDKLCEVNESLISFYNVKRTEFWAAYFLTLIHHIAGALEVYLILYFIKIRISFIDCVGIEIGIMIFKTLGSFVPGQIGIEEYANKLMLQFANINAPYSWVVVSIIKRARQIFWIMLGVFAFIILSRKRFPESEGIKNSNEIEQPEGFSSAATIYNS